MGKDNLKKLLLADDYEGVLNEVINSCVKDAGYYAVMEQKNPALTKDKYRERDCKLLRKQLEESNQLFDKVIKIVEGEGVSFSEKLDKRIPLTEIDVDKTMMEMMDLTEDEFNQLLKLGEDLAKNDRRDEAFDLLSLCAILNPKSSQAWKDLGILAFTQNVPHNFDLSVHYLRRAYELNPNDIGIIFVLIESYSKGGHKNEAKYLYQQLVNRYDKLSPPFKERLKELRDRHKPKKK